MTIIIALSLVISTHVLQAQDTWTQVANFGGTARYGAVGFSIGSKGYIGTGYDTGYKNDFWQYDPATDSWTQKADFGGSARYFAVGFSIDSKGYIGTGDDGSYTKDFWRRPCFKHMDQESQLRWISQVLVNGIFHWQ